MTPMPSLRDPETLHPLLQALWVAFMSRVRAAGLNPVLTFAWRSKLSQDRLYQIGRRGIPGERTVTNAAGGHSWHNVERNGQPAALSFDIALLTDDGKHLLPDSHIGWMIAAEIGEALGLTCGIRWKMRDAGHYQLDDGGRLTLEDAMAGTDPAGGVA